MTAENLGKNWGKSKARAMKLYDKFNREPSSALIALGSVKANPLVEVILAKAFSAAPFASQDDVATPQDRSCPILFRYREKDNPFGRDPQPPACCGGVQLAANAPAPLCGMYYETETGQWEGRPWELASNDVAFLFYAYQPNKVQVQVACGGFSARATRRLSRKLKEITRELGKPQFISKSLHMGLYLINFAFDPKDGRYSRDYDDRACDFRVIPLDEEVLSRRLAPKRTARRRTAAPTKRRAARRDRFLRTTNVKARGRIFKDRRPAGAAQGQASGDSRWPASLHSWDALLAKSCRRQRRRARMQGGRFTPHGFHGENCTMKFTALSALALTLLALPASSLSAADYFVEQNSPAADDRNPGGEAKPFKTIQAAVDAAKSGDTIYVKAGVYSDIVNVRGFGRPTRPITLTAWKDDRVVIGSELRELPAADHWKRIGGRQS